MARMVTGVLNKSEVPLSASDICCMLFGVNPPWRMWQVWSALDEMERTSLDRNGHWRNVRLLVKNKTVLYCVPLLFSELDARGLVGPERKAETLAGLRRKNELEW